MPSSPFPLILDYPSLTIPENMKLSMNYSPTNSIDWGVKRSDTSIQVYFGTLGFSVSGFTSEGFIAYEIAQFQKAFVLISAVTNVTFDVVNSASASNFRLVLATNQFSSNNDLGFFQLPNFTGNSNGVFNGSAWDRSAGGNLEVGGSAFVTVTHELLHGLGFAHPHDTGGTSTAMPGVTGPFNSYGQDGLNQGIYTTLTYNSGYNTGEPGSAGQPNYFNGTGGGWGYEAGPMALDIAVLQDKYGANTTTAGGADTYTLTTSNTSSTHWKSIWDTGGVDTITHTGTQTATIDLRPATLLSAEGGGGYISSVQGIAGGFTIAAGVVIENATGGNGADRIIGNDAGNLLIGDADLAAAMNADVFSFRTQAEGSPEDAGLFPWSAPETTATHTGAADLEMAAALVDVDQTSDMIDTLFA